eukprot:11172174-Heterocapsa_arctica.AAC.1
MPDEVRCSVVAMHAPRAIQSYLRVNDIDLLVNNQTLRRSIFKFLTRGRAFGNEGQLQGVPMELDALTGPPSSSRPWARAVLPKGKGKAGGPTVTPASRREIEGWWMRPCRHCYGRHMDKDCPKAPPGLT